MNLRYRGPIVVLDFAQCSVERAGAIEQEVPGARVYASDGGSGYARRVNKGATGSRIFLEAPWHAAAALRDARSMLPPIVSSARKMGNGGAHSDLPPEIPKWFYGKIENHRPQLLELGREEVRHARVDGRLSPRTPKLRRFQEEFAGVAMRAAALQVGAVTIGKAGAGKTGAAIIAAQLVSTTDDGPVVVVCRGGLRGIWWAEIPRFAPDWSMILLEAPSKQGPRDLDLTEQIALAGGDVPWAWTSSPDLPEGGFVKHWAWLGIGHRGAQGQPGIADRILGDGAPKGEDARLRALFRASPPAGEVVAAFESHYSETPELMEALAWTRGAKLDWAVHDGRAAAAAAREGYASWPVVATGCSAAAQRMRLTWWRAEAQRRKGRPCIIVGRETLADYYDLVGLQSPAVLIEDEIHDDADPVTTEAVPLKGGGMGFESKRTKGGKLIQAAATENLALWETIQHHFGLSATVLTKGKPKKIFQPLHRVDPHGFGSYKASFRWAYCDAEQDPRGYGVREDGESRTAELRERVHHLLHDVPYEESHGDLPPLTVSVTWHDERDLDKPPSLSSIMAKRRGVDDGGSEQARIDSADEVGIISAACMKRSLVLSRAIDEVRDGGAVVIATARIAEAKEWTERLAKLIDKDPILRGRCGLRALLAEGDDAASAIERNQVTDGWFRSRAQTGQPTILVGTLGVLGVGLNGMQFASLGILTMLDWRPFLILQFLGRFRRPGMEKPSRVWIPLVRGGVETKIARALSKEFDYMMRIFSSGEIGDLDQQLIASRGSDQLAAAALAAASKGLWL